MKREENNLLVLKRLNMVFVTRLRTCEYQNNGKATNMCGICEGGFVLIKQNCIFQKIFLVQIDDIFIFCELTT